MGGKCKTCERWYRKKADHKCGGTVIKCDVCEHLFINEYQFNQHKNRKKPCVKSANFKTVHVNENKRKCTTCQKEFPFYYQHVCPGVLKCDVCDKTFVNRGNLTRHKSKKTPCRPKSEKAKVLKCLHCDRVFTNQGNLTMHQKTHPCDSDYYSAEETMRGL